MPVVLITGGAVCLLALGLAALRLRRRVRLLEAERAAAARLLQTQHELLARRRVRRKLDVSGTLVVQQATRSGRVYEIPLN